MKLSYMIYNLSTGKVEHDSQFPTDAQAFMGSHRSDISLHNTGDVSVSSEDLLNLAMLNKLRCHPHLNFQPIRLLDPDCGYKVTYLMTTVLIQISWQGISGFSRTRVMGEYLVLILG